MYNLMITIKNYKIILKTYSTFILFYFTIYEKKINISNCIHLLACL